MRGARDRPAARFLFVPNVLILIAVSAGPAVAQVTGKVIGTVTDGETGRWSSLTLSLGLPYVER